MTATRPEQTASAGSETIYRFWPPDKQRPTQTPEDVPTADEIKTWIEMTGHPPPKMIVFCSSSPRKAIMLMMQLNGLKRVIATTSDTGEMTVTNANPTPQEFYDHLATVTTNKNGELTERVLLGFYLGVPVYIDPQNGETKDNHPGDQATKKVLHVLQEKEEYQNEDVILLSADTVDGPTQHSLRRDDHLASKHPLFPKSASDIADAPQFDYTHMSSPGLFQMLGATPVSYIEGPNIKPGVVHAPDMLTGHKLMFNMVFHSLVLAMLNNEREDGGLLLGKPSGLEFYPTDPKEQQAFLYWYKIILLKGSSGFEASTYRHTNGVAMLRTFGKGKDFPAESVQTWTTDLVAPSKYSAEIKVRPENGGGGMIQQFINVFASGIMRDLIPDGDIALLRLLPDHNPANAETPNILYDQITGMPVWLLLFAITQSGQKGVPEK